MQMKSILNRAKNKKILIPGFNVPYLPMMEGIVEALVAKDAFGLIMVARLEWIKFQSKGMKEIAEEYLKFQDPRYTRLHLDHIPVIDEDGLRVDYIPIIREALELGYDSVMIDGSRLPLYENIEAACKVLELARPEGVPVEAELGAVFGHESGELALSYEDLYTSRKGFTDIKEAERFVQQTGIDLLSVAVGNVHGAISEKARKEEKIKAKIDLEHISRLAEATGTPLVLHGGSGIAADLIKQAVPRGIVKLNIGTDIRKVYESFVQEEKYAEAIKAVMIKTEELLDLYGITGSASKLTAVNIQNNGLEK